MNQHTPESEVEKWAENARYLAKRLKEQKYEDIERHFVDFTKSALGSIATTEYERGKADEARRRDGIEKAIEQSIIDQRVTAERARIVEWVKKEKARLQECDSEAFGYELLEDKCCPGDDAAFGYEKALDHLINHLTK